MFVSSCDVLTIREHHSSGVRQSYTELADDGMDGCGNQSSQLLENECLADKFLRQETHFSYPDKKLSKEAAFTLCRFSLLSNSSLSLIYLLLLPHPSILRHETTQVDNVSRSAGW